MAYDATKMADWEIAEAAEANMPDYDYWREKLGLQKDDLADRPGNPIKRVIGLAARYLEA